MPEELQCTMQLIEGKWWCEARLAGKVLDSAEHDTRGARRVVVADYPERFD